MKRKYVFFLDAGGREQVVLVEAENVHEAMESIEKEWYSGVLENGFTVKVITGSQTSKP